MLIQKVISVVYYPPPAPPPLKSNKNSKVSEHHSILTTVGKRCKEKQMTVLGQVPLLGEGRASSTFTTHPESSIDSEEDVRRLFALFAKSVHGDVLKEWVEEVLGGK
jgi:hypothetical protein